MRRLLFVGMLVGCAGQNAQVRPQAETQEEDTARSQNEAGITAERQDAIEQLFRRKANDLQNCWVNEYEKSHNRKVEGDVTLDMNITPGGKATNVRVTKSTLGNANIESCMTGAIASWAFPEGSMNVPYHRTVHIGAQF